MCENVMNLQLTSIESIFSSGLTIEITFPLFSLPPSPAPPLLSMKVRLMDFQSIKTEIILCAQKTSQLEKH